MSFVTIYLVGYFLLLAGAALAMWQSGILQRIPSIWIAIAAVVSIGLGIGFGALARSRAVPGS